MTRGDAAEETVAGGKLHGARDGARQFSASAGRWLNGVCHRSSPGWARRGLARSHFRQWEEWGLSCGTADCRLQASIPSFSACSAIAATLLQCCDMPAQPAYDQPAAAPAPAPASCIIGEQLSVDVCQPSQTPSRRSTLTCMAPAAFATRRLYRPAGLVSCSRSFPTIDTQASAAPPLRCPTASPTTAMPMAVVIMPSKTAVRHSASRMRCSAADDLHCRLFAAE